MENKQTKSCGEYVELNSVSKAEESHDYIRVRTNTPPPPPPEQPLPPEPVQPLLPPQPHPPPVVHPPSPAPRPPSTAARPLPPILPPDLPSVPPLPSPSAATSSASPSSPAAGARTSAPQTWDDVDICLPNRTDPVHKCLIDRHYAVLRRSIDPNEYLLSSLAARGSEILSIETHQEISAQRTTCERNDLLVRWLSDSPPTAFKIFMKVLRATGQEHVANLLSGTTTGRLPMSEARYNRLREIKPHLMMMVKFGEVLMSCLVRDKAVSDTDKEIINSKPTNFEKNAAMIDAISRRSEDALDSLKRALSETDQDFLVPYLTKGEIIGIHVNTSKPDLDQQVADSLVVRVTRSSSKNINRKKGKYSQDDLSIFFEKNLKIVGAAPGHSVVVYFYCESDEDTETLMRMMETGELRQMMETIVPKLVADGGTLSVEDVSFDDDGGVTYNNEYVKLKDFLKTRQAPLGVTRIDEPPKCVGGRTELSVNIARRSGPSIGGARRVKQSKDLSETFTQKENQSNLVEEKRDRSRGGVQRNELLTTRFNTPSLTVLLSQPDDTTIVKNDVPLRLHTRINRRVTSLRFFRCCAANSSDEETTVNPDLGSKLEVETGMDSNSKITADYVNIKTEIPLEGRDASLVQGQTRLPFHPDVVSSQTGESLVGVWSRSSSGKKAQPNPHGTVSHSVSLPYAILRTHQNDPRRKKNSQGKYDYVNMDKFRAGRRHANSLPSSVPEPDAAAAAEPISSSPNQTKSSFNNSPPGKAAIFIPKDGNIRHFTSEEMQAFLREFHAPTETIRRWTELKIDGERFSNMSNAELSNYKVSGTIVQFFRDHSKQVK